MNLINNMEAPRNVKAEIPALAKNSNEEDLDAETSVEAEVEVVEEAEATLDEVSPRKKCLLSKANARNMAIPNAEG